MRIECGSNKSKCNGWNVGKEAAKEIHDKGWILEDYIEHHGFAYNLRLN